MRQRLAKRKNRPGKRREYRMRCLICGWEQNILEDYSTRSQAVVKPQIYPITDTGTPAGKVIAFVCKRCLNSANRVRQHLAKRKNHSGKRREYRMRRSGSINDVRRLNEQRQRKEDAHRASKPDNSPHEFFGNAAQGACVDKSHVTPAEEAGWASRLLRTEQK
jgi:hypothetical protein